MLVATWELHFAAPGSPDVLVDLGDLKRQFTEMRIDWFDDGDRLSVMVSDVEVLLQTLLKLQQCTLQSISCSFSDGSIVSGRMVLDDDLEENSVASVVFPTSPDAE